MSVVNLVFLINFHDVISSKSVHAFYSVNSIASDYAICVCYYLHFSFLMYLVYTFRDKYIILKE